jgi:malic enzyme
MVLSLAALFNALRLVNKDKQTDRLKIVIAGARSAGYGIFRLVTKVGCSNIIVSGSIGLYAKRFDFPTLGKYKKEMALLTDLKQLKRKGMVSSFRDQMYLLEYLEKRISWTKE